MARCDAVVFLTLDPSIRMARIEERERVRRSAGGVDEESLTTFLAWARGYDDPAFDGRSRLAHEKWLAERHHPVLRLDGAASREELRDRVLDWIPDH